MRRLFIIHGYTGNPQKNWFPWLKTEAEKLGFIVAVPQMPNPFEPKLDEWLPALQKLVGDADEDTYFACHSLGTATLLRFLQHLPDDQKIGGAVLAAAFAEKIPTFPELDNFVTGTWDDAKIKRSARKIAVLASNNDKHLPLTVCEHVRDRFNTDFTVLQNAGHINAAAGFTEAPVILDALKKIAAIS